MKLDEMRKIKTQCEGDLLFGKKYHGVTGVDIGYKLVGGKKTDELAIRVLVEKKRDNIPESQRICPELFDGVPIDVIERKFVFPPESADKGETEETDDLRLKGGIGIAPQEHSSNKAVGTLGAIVKDRDSSRMMFLTCSHVLDNLEDNTPIQWVKSGGESPEVIGTFQKFRHRGRQKNLCLNEMVDGVVVPLDDREEYSSEITGIGRIRGISFATSGMQVRKWGHKTKLTYGIVDTTDLTLKINHKGQELHFTNQIGIIAGPARKTKFGDSGDSGAVVVNNTQEAVGLYFARSVDGMYSVANPIGAVLDALHVDLHEETLYGLAKDIDNSMRGIAWFTKLLEKDQMQTRPSVEVIQIPRSLQFLLTHGHCNDC